MQANMKKIKKILREQLEKIKPSQKETEELKKNVDDFISILNKKLAPYKGRAILGGSFAKGTLIKKERYDIDIFALFPKQEKISEKLQAALKKTAVKFTRLKGSRDYFSLVIDKTRIEVVPILEIKKVSEAENVTDVSPFHVTYIKGIIKKKPALADEIRLAKAFCHAQNCYGAESHIKGFSGYALELLVCYYGSFLALLNAAKKWHTQLIIDPAKHYKNKQEILEEINEAKLLSPIVLVDPVQKERNATAALSNECFEKFVNACKNFFSEPEKAFEKKELLAEEWKKEAKRKGALFFSFCAKSIHKKEDVAGAKLLKFFNLLSFFLKKDYSVLKKEWQFFPEKREAEFFFILKKKILIRGPPKNMPQHVEKFRKKYKNIFFKNGKACARGKEKSIAEIIKKMPKEAKEEIILSFQTKWKKALK